MKQICLAIILLWALCGCFKRVDDFTTPGDYERAFQLKQKISLQNKTQLNLSDARELALANNPTLRSAAAAIRSAQYTYFRSLSAWSPEVTAYGEVNHALAAGHDLHHPPSGVFPGENRFATSSSIKATWLLFNGLARELDILVTQLEYDRSIAAAEDVKRLLLQAVVFAWCDILLASEEIIIYQADKAFQDAALTQANEQFKAGHISYATVLNFKILSAKAQSRITLSRYQRQTAYNALAALLGYNTAEFPADIKLQFPEPSVMALDHPLPRYLEEAIRNRPDLKAEKLQLEKSLRQKQAAYAAFLPEIHLFADFSFDNAYASYRKYPVKWSYYNQPSFVYGVTGSWNIFRGFESWNELRRRQALEQIAKWGLNKKFLDVTTEVNDALENCRNTRKQVAIFRSMANWVMEQRNLIYSEYLNGRETIARVNQAQSELLEAQSSLILWKIQSRKAAAQLAAALGKDAIVADKKLPVESGGNF